MSIENDLNRIANALEKIVDVFANPTVVMSREAIATLATPEITQAFADPAPVAPAPAKKAGRPVGSKNAPAAPAPAPAAEPAVSVTKDDVMDLMRELVRKLGPEKGPQAGKEILAQYGAGRISELQEQHFPAAFQALQKALK